MVVVHVEEETEGKKKLSVWSTRQMGRRGSGWQGKLKTVTVTGTPVFPRENWSHGHRDRIEFS